MPSSAAACSISVGGPTKMHSTSSLSRSCAAARMIRGSTPSAKTTRLRGKLAVEFILTLIDSYVSSQLGPVVLKQGANQDVVFHLLHDLKTPAGDSTYRENRHKQVLWNSV